MAIYTIDQKRLLDLHATLDDATYAVGLDSKGRAKGKAAFSEDAANVTALDCSGYTKFILYKASEGKIKLPGGSWNQNDWCKKQGLKTEVYKKAAGKSDNILRLGYFKKTAKMNYGHIWLVLNGQTLESHGSRGVNRRRWNTGILLNHATHCYQVARTTTLSPAKYRVTSKLKDPELRKLLDARIDNDKKISDFELLEIILAVCGDGKVMQSEIDDLNSILQYSASITASGRNMLNGFIRNAKIYKPEDKRPTPNSSGGNKSATQKADEEFYRNHPERKGRALTNSKADAPLRKEWIQLYKKHGGK